jgi:fatty acid synthase
VISSDCVNSYELLQKASSSFGENGFFICRERHGVKLQNVVLPTDYDLISSIATEDEFFVILKFSKNKINQLPLPIHISERDESFEWIESVKAVMKNNPIVLIAENEPTSGLVGLVNCLRKEPEGSLISCVFIDDKTAPKFSLDNSFYQNQLKLGLAINVLKNGAWGSYRHLQIQQNFAERSALDHCYVNALVKSDLSSLKWISGPFNYSRPNGELVRVQYAALNFRDVMLATGKLSADVFAENRKEHECVLGIEYSGVTAKGRRVMGMTMAAAMVKTKISPFS